MTTPEVSIIAAGSPTMAPECAVIAAESPVQEPTVVKNVDCRRRKPNLLKGRQSSPQFSSAMRKSVRFSTVLDDSDLGERTTTKANVAAKASVSSPFVKRVRNTRVRQTKPAEIELSSEEEVSRLTELIKLINPYEAMDITFPYEEQLCQLPKLL